MSLLVFLTTELSSQNCTLAALSLFGRVRERNLFLFIYFFKIAGEKEDNFPKSLGEYLIVSLHFVNDPYAWEPQQIEQACLALLFRVTRNGKWTRIAPTPFGTISFSFSSVVTFQTVFSPLHPVTSLSPTACTTDKLVNHSLIRSRLWCSVHMDAIFFRQLWGFSRDMFLRACLLNYCAYF